MAQDPNDVGGTELRAEHVLAALDQIEKVTAQLRKAVSVLPPKTVIAHIPHSGPKGPPGVELLGECLPPPEKS